MKTSDAFPILKQAPILLTRLCPHFLRKCRKPNTSRGDPDYVPIVKFSKLYRSLATLFKQNQDIAEFQHLVSINLCTQSHWNL